ncbi:hypothetical protein C8F01DRAFT_638574 [Mycena amicta]|nr:hypothetical protein C8F01DRAFT_638574 [Mycena amicta]
MQMLFSLLTLCVLTSQSAVFATHHGPPTPNVPTRIGTYPPVGTFTITNLDSRGLLFVDTDGIVKVDFRGTAGKGNTTFWEIHDADPLSSPDIRSTMRNVGTGQVATLLDKGKNTTEFFLRPAGNLLYAIEAPRSHWLWDVEYTDFDVYHHYPAYQELVLAKPPTKNDRVSIFWRIDFLP